MFAMLLIGIYCNYYTTIRFLAWSCFCQFNNINGIIIYKEGYNTKKQVCLIKLQNNNLQH
jgi:hypothetical protein